MNRPARHLFEIGTFEEVALFPINTRADWAQCEMTEDLFHVRVAYDTRRHSDFESDDETRREGKHETVKTE